MIKPLIISILSIAFIPVNAQNKSISIQTTASFIDKTLRVLSSPQLEIKKSNHLWSFGPAILMTTEKAVSEKKYPKLVGLQGTYRAYPLEGPKRINFFLFDDLLIQRIVNKWTSTIWDNSQQTYVAYKYSSAELILQNHVGYGIELTLGKHLVTRNSFGIGFYYANTKGHSESDGAPNTSFNDENINGYDPFGFSWLINFGVGYQL
jgi:hypothetical protein